MPPVRVKYVVSFSSQAPRNTVENLIKGHGCWLSDANDRTGRLQADIQLERATTISYIDLGNAGSVMVSVEVGRSSWPSNKPLVTLLPTVALMTPTEWRAGKNSKTVRMFKKEDLDKDAVKEKWDRVRIICTQPFRKDSQFGLALFRLHTTDECPVQDVSPVNPHYVPEKLTQSEMKKDELVSRMNLPANQKKVMSQSLGWLENKVLTNGDDANAVNPFTSPVSRAAKLVVMATKPISRESTVSQKVNLECEALDFLITLNLTISDINSLKVSAVRQQFENHRKKLLTHDEKIIFKDIALDYAKNRLENLEKKHENTSEINCDMRKNSGKNREKKPIKEKENNSKGYTPNKAFCKEKTAMQEKVSKKEIGSIPSHTTQKPHGKFTFKKIEAPKSSLLLLKTGNLESRNVSKDNLGAKSVAGLSRNELALSESKVTTPAKARVRSRKSSTPKSVENNQPTVNTWITPKGKRKRSSPNSRQFSSDLSAATSILDWNDSSDDTSFKNKQGGGFIDDKMPSSSADQRNDDDVASGDRGPGYSLGSFPGDKFGVTQARKRPRGASSEHMNSSPRSSHASKLVECPLCSGFFTASKITSHAASCGNVISSDSDSDDLDSSGKGGSMEECPVCGDFVSSVNLQEHAADCANLRFG